MQINNFKKLIFLPSGGLDYSPYIWLYPITNAILLLDADPNISDSTLDFELAIIGRYVDFGDQNLLNILMSDIHFLWFYISVLEFHKDAQLLLENHKCFECKENINIIKIDLTKINISYFNPLEDSISLNYEITVEDLILTFRRRRVKDNLHFAHLVYSAPKKENDLEDLKYKLILFIATQLDNINFKNEDIPIKKWFEVFNILSYDQIAEVFNIIVKKEKDIGLDNEVFFNCEKCGKENKINIFDDFNLSQISLYDHKRINQKQEEIFNNLISMARLPIFNMSEYLDMPLRFANSLGNALQNTKFTTLF